MLYTFCRFIGKSEPAIVVALYFHMSTAVLSGIPLAFSWPQAAKAISWFDALMLVGVAAGSFLGQLFMTRSLQLENASLISSLNFSQVRTPYGY
jgi:drug/metabolite transporter (DMT)-like permease